jgi:hypothetical protein
MRSLESLGGRVTDTLRQAINESNRVLDESSGNLARINVLGTQRKFIRCKHAKKERSGGRGQRYISRARIARKSEIYTVYLKYTVLIIYSI